MLRIRLVHRTVIVTALVVGLLFAGTLHPAPAAADSTDTAIIIGAAFGAYLVLVLTVTTIIYYKRERDRERNRPPTTTHDPYSFTSNRLRRPTSNDGLQFGSRCAAHGPGAILCW